MAEGLDRTGGQLRQAKGHDEKVPKGHCHVALDIPGAFVDPVPGLVGVGAGEEVLGKVLLGSHKDWEVEEGG